MTQKDCQDKETFMVIDTSAILSILLNEQEAPIIAELVAKDSKRLLSAGTALE
jgi:uncharacterized protein with PIN domain